MTLPLLCEFFAEGKEKRLGEKEGYGTVGGGHVLIACGSPDRY